MTVRLDSSTVKVGEGSPAMVTEAYELRIDGRLTDKAREACGDIRIERIPAGTTLDGKVIGEPRPGDRRGAPAGRHDSGANPGARRDFHQQDLPEDIMTGRERAGRVLHRVMTHRWTAAETEAARFVSGCIAAGALLGLVTAAVRPMTAERHG